MNVKAQEILDRIKNLIKNVAILVNHFPNIRSSYRISDQIMGSVTSVGANFVEAQSARSKKEFISTMGIVLKEIKETVFWLEIIEELKLCSGEEIQKPKGECLELSKMFSSAIITASKNELR